MDPIAATTSGLSGQSPLTRLRLPQYRLDPYALYREYRESDPVHQMESAAAREWFVTRYDDVSIVLRDSRFIREWRKVAPAESLSWEPPDPWRVLYQMQSQWMLFRDPPDHTRLRSLVNKAFTPRVVDGLRPRIDEIARELLTEAVARGDSIDVVTDYAFPLPVIVIAEMLGVPATDRTLFRAWSSAIAVTLDIGPADEAALIEGGRVAAELLAYFRDLAAERRKRPRNDLVSALLAVEESGDALSEDELLSTCVLLLLAGHETTVNLISNSVWLMTEHPHAASDLRAQPELIPGAVEEFLRFESPVQLTTRIAGEDVELGGKTIRRGETVHAALASANRDEQQFPDPDQLNIRRSPNRHLAFATGIHFCLGAPLARAEGAIAIQTLLDVLPELPAPCHSLEWRDSSVFRGPTKLVLPLK